MKTLTLTFILTTNVIICFGQNLISNSNFETSGQINCQSWFDLSGRELSFLCDTIYPDTIYGTMFYQDAPSTGDNWSLGITGEGNSPANFAETYITGLNGTNIYRLNIWIKDLAQYASGGVFIYTKSQGQTTFINSIFTDSSDWTFYSLIDTFAIQFYDTIIISLAAGAAGPMQGTIFFDLVELNIIDTITFLNDILNNDKTLIESFPNPSNGQIKIQTYNDKLKTIIINESKGQAIKIFETTQAAFTISIPDIKDGLYFYQILNTIDKKIIGKGKFIKQ